MITKSVIIPAVRGLYRPTGLLFHPQTHLHAIWPIFAYTKIQCVEIFIFFIVTYLQPIWPEFIKCDMEGNSNMCTALHFSHEISRICGKPYNFLTQRLWTCYFSFKKHSIWFSTEYTHISLDDQLLLTHGRDLNTSVRWFCHSLHVVAVCCLEKLNKSCVLMGDKLEY